MSTYIFGVRITMSDKASPLTEDTSIGLYNVASDNSEFRWIQTQKAGLADTWRADMLIPGGIGKISRNVDLKLGGNVSKLGGVTIKVKNTSKLWDTLRDGSIYIYGQRVEVVYFVDTTETVIWRGIVKNISWDRLVFNITCKPPNDMRKANLITQLNVTGTDKKVDVPLTFGEWRDVPALMVQTINKDETLTNREILEEQFNVTSLSATPDGEKSFPIINLGTDTPTRNYTWRHTLSNSWDTNDSTKTPSSLYIKVIEDENDNEKLYRKIASMNLSQNIEQVSATISTFFPVTLTADSGGNGSWVEVHDIEKRFELDRWPMENNIDSDGVTISATTGFGIFSYEKRQRVEIEELNKFTDILVGDDEFIPLPKYGVEITSGETGKNKYDIVSEQYENDPENLNSYLILPFSEIKMYDGNDLQDVLVNGFDNTDWLDSAANIKAGMENVVAGVFKYSPEGNDKISTGAYSEVGTVDNVADQYINTEYQFGFTSTQTDYGFVACVVECTLPQIPSGYEIDKSYVIGADNFQLSGTDASGIDLYLKGMMTYGKWIGDSQAVYDGVKLNNEFSGIGAFDINISLDNLPDFYIKDRLTNNQYFYSSVIGGSTLNGVVNTELTELSDNDKYKAYSKVYLIYMYSMQFAKNTTVSNILKLKDFAIALKRKIKTKDKLYTRIRGRTYNDTLGARKTAENMIDTPTGILEHVNRLQNWGDYTNLTPTLGWGHGYSGSAQINTGTGSGGFDSNELTEVNALRPAAQVTKHSDAWTDKMKRSLCRDFWLLSYNDNDGNECVRNVERTASSATIPLVTLADIRRTGGKITIKEPDPTDIYVEPFVRYNKNSGSGEYDGIIAIRKTSAPYFDENYDPENPSKGGYVEDSGSGLIGTSASVYWGRCHDLWEKYGIINEPQNDLTDAIWANGNTGEAAKIAAYKLKKWIDWMGNRYITFPVHFLHASNGINTRDWNEGQHFDIQLPHETDNAITECITEKITINPNPPYHINVEAILLDSGDIPEDFDIQDVTYTAAEGAGDDWQDTTDENETQIQDVT